MIVLSENVKEITVDSDSNNDNYVRFPYTYLHGKCEDNNGCGMPDICYCKKSDLEKIMNDLNELNSFVPQHYSVSVIKFSNSVSSDIEILNANLIIKMEYPKLQKVYGLVTCVTEPIADLNKN